MSSGFAELVGAAYAKASTGSFPPRRVVVGLGHPPTGTIEARLPASSGRVLLASARSPAYPGTRSPSDG